MKLSYKIEKKLIFILPDYYSGLAKVQVNSLISQGKVVCRNGDKLKLRWIKVLGYLDKTNYNQLYNLQQKNFKQI